MPPSSRKRNKGKERKAKKDKARVQNIWRRWLLGYLDDGKRISMCNHGCPSLVPDDHPAVFTSWILFLVIG